jgi:hypothetical protein
MGGRDLLRVVLLPLAIALPAAPCTGSASENPAQAYRSIADRNLFGLTNAPAPQRVQQQAPDLPRVKLTGITTILGTKQAVLRVEPPGAKPGRPGIQGRPVPGQPVPLPGQPVQLQEPESLILAEGQREGNIEVLQIDEQAGTVRMVNAGQPMTITFEEEPVQVAAPPPVVPPLPGTPGAAPGLAGMPPVDTNVNQTAVAGMPPPALPSPAAGGLPSRTYSQSADTAGAANLTVLAPETGGETNMTPTAPGQAPLTPEEQAMLLQLQNQFHTGTQVENEPPPAHIGVPEQHIYQHQQPPNPRDPGFPPRFGRQPLLPQ